MDYLETVVNVGSDNEGRGPGAKYAQNLKNFQNLLFKINTEMPWFWESISGLEGTMQYRGMQDPFWGKDKKIDIEIICEEPDTKFLPFSSYPSMSVSNVEILRFGLVVVAVGAVALVQTSVVLS